MIEDAESVAVGTATPVPLRAACCGLPLAVSVTNRAAERAPAAVASKVMAILQLPDAARSTPQLVALIAKSPGFVPPMARFVMASGALPELLRVMLWAAVATPILEFPKLSDVGVRVTAATPMPVPDNATVC